MHIESLLPSCSPSFPCSTVCVCAVCVCAVSTCLSRSFLSESAFPALKCQLSTVNLCGFCSAWRWGGNRRRPSIAALQTQGGSLYRKIRRTDRQTDGRMDAHAAPRQGESELTEVYATGKDCFWKRPRLNTPSGYKIPFYFLLSLPTRSFFFSLYSCCSVVLQKNIV